MSNINIFYAIHDFDPFFKKRGAFPIREEALDNFNNLGYGIFWTPNFFEGARKKENLKYLNYWLADIDCGTKEEQMKRINSLKIPPTVIVETKKGYHCYWNVKGECSPENYEKIEKGIIFFLMADKFCKDVTRLLRLPNYLHQKDIKNPFKIKMVHCEIKEYTTKQMLFYFDITEKSNLKKNNFNIETQNKQNAFFDENNWSRFFGLDNIVPGNRNSEFARIRLWLKDENFTNYEIYDLISKMNKKIIKSLDDKEIRLICKIKE